MSTSPSSGDGPIICGKVETVSKLIDILHSRSSSDAANHNVIPPNASGLVKMEVLTKSTVNNRESLSPYNSGLPSLHEYIAVKLIASASDPSVMVCCVWYIEFYVKT